MNVKVAKYDPNVDTAPYFITVNVKDRILEKYKDSSKKKVTTLLEVIQFAHEKTPISFDYSCRGRQCGRCTVMLNGVPCMACCTFVDLDEVNINTTYIVEPLKGFPILRDLIVYKREAHDALTALYERQKDPALDLTKLDVLDSNYNEQFSEQINSIEWCARCMACTTACPAHNANPNKFVGPAAMLAIAYRYYDRYDKGSAKPGGSGDRIAQAVSAGLWNCIMCGQCDHVCIQKEMKKVKQIWKDLRDAATAAGYKNPYA